MDERSWLECKEADKMVDFLGNDPRHDDALIRFAIACIKHHPPRNPASREPARGPGNGYVLARWATRNALPPEGPERDVVKAWQADLLRDTIQLPKAS